MSAPSSSFHGFGDKALPFFRALGFHQDRAWFQENKALYESEVLQPLSALVSSLNEACIARGLPLRGSPKASIFRIHRDVRFAKDKTPFKTHASALLSRSGSKDGQGVFYIHVGPEESFFGAGFHDLDTAGLAAFRGSILADPARLKALLAALSGQGLAFDPRWSLKRAPREAAGVTDEAVLAALKLKSFVARRPIAESRLTQPDLLADCLSFIEDSLPLLEFGWSALSTIEPARG
ncbi:TIGR02453 family protein [Labrys monachus]|uniref:Uncharacterized protein (TIGR02453 family) n=1 Tax=Labrys monachus TaxID=217067 RepID=A0ABU0FP74_9HYPH|nr:TIGR02453 family protein [Labrys monachus]MDQ0396417.1 uncharacterized protein (TIGR02453 family) [Labrys monachus]